MKLQQSTQSGGLASRLVVAHVPCFAVTKLFKQRACHLFTVQILQRPLFHHSSLRCFWSVMGNSTLIDHFVYVFGKRQMTAPKHFTGNKITKSVQLSWTEASSQGREGWDTCMMMLNCPSRVPCSVRWPFIHSITSRPVLDFNGTKRKHVFKCRPEQEWT